MSLTARTGSSRNPECHFQEPKFVKFVVKCQWSQLHQCSMFFFGSFSQFAKHAKPILLTQGGLFWHCAVVDVQRSAWRHGHDTTFSQSQQSILWQQIALSELQCQRKRCHVNLVHLPLSNQLTLSVARGKTLMM